MDPVYAAALRTRAIVLWVAVRAALAVFGVLLQESPLPAHIMTSLLIVTLVAGAVHLDTRFQRELVFQANLGRSAAGPVRLAAVLAGGAELALSSIVLLARGIA